MAITKIMCFGKGEQEDPGARKNKEIERQLREDQKKMSKEVKLLLLGMAYPSTNGVNAACIC